MLLFGRYEGEERQVFFEHQDTEPDLLACF